MTTIREASIAADQLKRGDTILITKPVNYGGPRGIVMEKERWRVLRVTKNKIQAQGALRYPEFFPKENENGEVIFYETEAIDASTTPELLNTK